VQCSACFAVLRASCLPQIPCSQPRRLLRAEWGRPSHRALGLRVRSLSCVMASRSPPASASGQTSREAHAARRARRGEQNTVGARHASCAWVAASGPMPTLEAQLRNRSSHHSKSQTRLELQARQHRSCLTESEARLWSALQARQLGVQFRPEVVLGGRFIVDFFASSVGLIVEVDGGYHARRRGADASRDRKLQRLGYRVVRVDAELVLRELGAAVAQIRAAL
jgi:very-short-patch-repair endonuclease